MHFYNPFGVDLDKLVVDDLDILRSVDEGWYVEYKENAPDIDRVAKSISSFANTYGGWVFYGVRQGSDSRIAESFPGLDIGQLNSLYDRVQQASASKINPPPHFDAKILKGPSEKLGLESDMGILAVKIPQGQDSPYVHQNGRIYIRIGDSSDPSHTNDISVLNRLWERRSNAYKRLKEFLEGEIELPREQEDQAFLHLFLFPDVFNQKGLLSKVSFNEFANFMVDKKSPGHLISFENAFTFSDGFMARYVGVNCPTHELLSWRYFKNCTSVITIPLNTIYMLDGEIHDQDARAKYKLLDSFVEKHFSKAAKSLELIDINWLFHILMHVMAKHRILLSRDGQFGPFFIKARIQGVLRRIPFLDVTTFTEFVGQHGLPVIQQNEIFVPAGEISSCFFLTAKRADSPDTEKLILEAAMGEAILLLFGILNALGLPKEVLSAMKVDEMNDYINRPIR